MKKARLIFILSALLVLLSSCAFILQSDDRFGFSRQKFAVVAEQDTHGGWLGDGYYYLILDCSGNVDEALANIAGWNSLPLPENLDLIMYGGEKGGVFYGYGLSETAHMPAIENGYYYFVDRHSEAKDASDDSGLFDRFSFNFTLAVYDSDTNRFYYFEYDT